MDPIKFKDEKQFKDIVQLFIVEKIQPQLEEIFGKYHPAITEIKSYIFNKATDAHKKRYQKRDESR